MISQSQRQSIVQQQRLSLSPQMVQSIRLMAMPYGELRERILEEVATNPALEVVRDPFIVPASPPDPARAGNNHSMTGRRIDGAGTTVDFTGSVSDDESDEHRDFIEGVLHHDNTLQEHLLSQLSELKLPECTATLASQIIQNLDRDGFHLVPPSELVGAQDLAVLEDALKVVQSLEPVGCATLGFQESLVVQAMLLFPEPDQWRSDPTLCAVVTILRDHIHLLEKGRPESLLKALSKNPVPGLSLDLEDAEAVFSVIRGLDPFPGRAIGSSPQSYAIPDVLVHRESDDFSVSINDEEIPVVGITPYFLEMDKKNGEIPREVRNFAHESVKEAQWFLHTLSRRNLTILKLVRALIVFQRDFFLHGPRHLAPLRMKDIAEEIGLHEATVSRAANGKYLQCEWGLFELRWFFSTSVGSSSKHTSSSPVSAGSSALTGRFSKQAVKEIMRDIIEDASENLSDQKIADLLAIRGIQIARRTVAKYRGELTIKSSYDRNNTSH